MNLIRRRFLLRGLATLSVAMWLTSISTAQMGGGGGAGGGSGGGGGGSSGGGGGSSGGGGAGGGSSSGGGGAGGGSGGGSGSTPGGGSLTTSSGSSGPNSTDPSNFLGPTYSNPLYMGRPNQNYSSSSSGASGITTTASGPGGFGQPSFGTTTSSTGRTGGTATTSTSGQGSSQSSNQSQPTYARLTYTTEVRFPVKRIGANQLETELRDMIDRSSNLKNPTGIKILVDGSTVVLAGKAVDEDERRLVEGMIRLTPGVRLVKNEIQVP